VHDFAVVPALLGDASLGLRQGLELLLFQEHITKPPIEALDATVLHRPFQLQQDMPNAMSSCPSL
jgi:hypothetical protein